MARDDWTRTVSVTAADLAVGEWQSRDRNPIALAIARVLRPGTSLFVDVGREEFFLSNGTHSEWFGLPDEFLPFAVRAESEGAAEEMAVVMGFPPWALLTERWAKKQGRAEPPLGRLSDAEPGDPPDQRSR